MAVVGEMQIGSRVRRRTLKVNVVHRPESNTTPYLKAKHVFVAPLCDDAEEELQAVEHLMWLGGQRVALTEFRVPRKAVRITQQV